MQAPLLDKFGISAALDPMHAMREVRSRPRTPIHVHHQQPSNFRRQRLDTPPPPARSRATSSPFPLRSLPSHIFPAIYSIDSICSRPCLHQLHHRSHWARPVSRSPDKKLLLLFHPSHSQPPMSLRSTTTPRTTTLLLEAVMVSRTYHQPPLPPLHGQH